MALKWRDVVPVLKSIFQFKKVSFIIDELVKFFVHFCCFTFTLLINVNKVLTEYSFHGYTWKAIATVS